MNTKHLLSLLVAGTLVPSAFAEVFIFPDFTRTAGEASNNDVHVNFDPNGGWSGTPPNAISGEESLYLKFTVSWAPATDIGSFRVRFNAGDDGGAARIGAGTEGSGFALINANGAGDGDGSGPATAKPAVDAVDKTAVTSTTFVLKVEQPAPSPGGDWWFADTTQQDGAGHFLYIDPDLDSNEATQSTKWAAWRSGNGSYQSVTFSTNTAGVDLNFTDIALYTGDDTPFSTAVGGVDATSSTVAASPAAVPANGSSTSTITVTLKDADGVPVEGILVSLTNTAGPGSPSINPADSGTDTTDFFGVATFTVSSSDVGTEVFTATADGVQVTQTASIDFTSVLTDAGNSTVAASPATIPADGNTQSFITVTLLNDTGQPLPGKLVSLANTDGPGAPTIDPVESGSDTTDANGVATFRVSSQTIGTEEFSATCETDSVTLSADTVSVNFVAQDAAQLLAYEGFDYDLGLLTGNDGGIGFAAGWVSPEGSFVASVYDQNGSTLTEWDNVFANSVVTMSSPPRYIATRDSQSNPQSTASRTLAADAGTLAGADNVLWMSSVFHYERAQGSAFLNLGLSSGGYITDRGRRLSIGGMDFIGVSNWAQPNNTWNTRLNATIVENHTTGTGYQEPYVQALGSVNPTVSDMFVVLKFTFGTSDRVEAAFFTESETISEEAFYSHPTYVSAIYAGDIDESGLNTITYNQQVGDNALDEIRIGSTFNDLLGIASITSFEAAGVTGVIDQAAKTITLDVPFGTNLATLAPEFTLTSGVCDQTSGSPPAPNFAAQNPVNYVVTDDSTDPDTVNTYSVTVNVAPQTATIVIDLGAGTVIEGNTFGTYGATNLPLPSLPAGSILQSIAADLTLEATDNENFARDIAVLLDPTPGTPGDDFSVGISDWSVSPSYGAGLELDWAANQGVGGAGASLVDTKTEADWASVGDIDLASTGVFLGNSLGGPTVGGTWSGTITLTHAVPAGGSDYDTWAAGFLPADVSDPGGDLDGDDLSNGAERAFGLDPTDPASVNPITVALDAGAGTFSYTRRDTALSGLTYSVWTSSDLENWNEDTGATEGSISKAGDVETVPITLSASPVGGMLYVQVRAN